jgi:hypothetical protein
VDKIPTIKAGFLSVFCILLLQACEASPVVKKPMESKQTEPEPSPKPAQTSGAQTMNQAKVELDIYSGRVNPSWLLTELETNELQTLLSQLQKTRPIEFAGNLGYRGVFVDLLDLKSGKILQLKVFKSVIEIQTDGSSQFFTDTNREIEHWLLKSGDYHLPNSEYQSLKEMAEQKMKNEAN